MDYTLRYLDLVIEAHQGSKKSMDSLARLVEPRLFSYLYRLVLNYDLAYCGVTGFIPIQI